MEDAKHFLASRTVWGVVVSLVAFGLQKAGFAVGEDVQVQMVDAALQIATVAGGLYAVYGRVKATKVIGPKPAAE